MVKEVGRFNVQGWAARDESGILSPFNFIHRETGLHDVTFKIVYCRICHTNLHQIRNEWKGSQYPMVPGHEIVGIVVEVGSEVKNFSVGDRVGVGYMVGSFHHCDSCSKGQEQHYEKVIWTYGSTDVDGSVTFGVPTCTKSVQNPTHLGNEAPQNPKAVSSKSPENGSEENTQYSRATLPLKFKRTDKWALPPKPSSVAAV